MPEERDAASFGAVRERLDEIADEVAREDIALDDALALYEEAVKLGLLACDLSESDLAGHAGEEAEEAEAEAAGQAPEEPSAAGAAGEPAEAEAEASAENAPAPDAGSQLG